MKENNQYSIINNDTNSTLLPKIGALKTKGGLSMATLLVIIFLVFFLIVGIVIALVLWKRVCGEKSADAKSPILVRSRSSAMFESDEETAKEGQLSEVTVK